MSYHGQPCEYKMRVALSYFGPMRIELIEMVEGPTVYADFVAEHGFGVQHLGVLVDDMGAALAQAEAAGFTMIMDGSGFGPDGDGHYAYLDTEKDYGVTSSSSSAPGAARHQRRSTRPRSSECLDERRSAVLSEQRVARGVDCAATPGERAARGCQSPVTRTTTRAPAPWRSQSP